MSHKLHEIVVVTLAVVGCLCMAASLVHASDTPYYSRGGSFAFGMAASYSSSPPSYGCSPCQWQPGLPSFSSSYAGAFANSGPCGGSAGASAFAGSAPFGGSAGAGAFAGSGPFGAQASAFANASGPSYGPPCGGSYSGCGVSAGGACMVDPCGRPGRIQVMVRPRPPRGHGRWPYVPGQ